MTRITIILLLIFVACKSDRPSSRNLARVNAAVSGYMSGQADGYKFMSATVIDTVYKGPLAASEIEQLKAEIAAHHARINQERLTIDIHQRTPNPEQFAQSDKSSRENMVFYRRLVEGATKDIQRLKPVVANNEQLGFVVAHRYEARTPKGTDVVEKYVFLSPELEVLLVHREDRHDIRTAVFNL